MWDFIICLEWTFHITGEILQPFREKKYESTVKRINLNKFYILKNGNDKSIISMDEWNYLKVQRLL